MSFAKASVKRFNEELNDAPAPNAYDAKMPQKKISAVSLAKDNLPRFQEPKVLLSVDFDVKIFILTDLSRMLVLAQASTWLTHLTRWRPSPRAASYCAPHHLGWPLSVTSSIHNFATFSGTGVRWAQGLTYLPRRTTGVSRRHAQPQAGESLLRFWSKCLIFTSIASGLRSSDVV